MEAKWNKMVELVRSEMKKREEKTKNEPAKYSNLLFTFFQKYML